MGHKGDIYAIQATIGVKIKYYTWFTWFGYCGWYIDNSYINMVIWVKLKYDQFSILQLVLAFTDIVLSWPYIYLEKAPTTIIQVTFTTNISVNTVHIISIDLSQTN